MCRKIIFMYMKKVIQFRRENKLEFITRRTDGEIIPVSEPERVFQFIENEYMCITLPWIWEISEFFIKWIYTKSSILKQFSAYNTIDNRYETQNHSVHNAATIPGIRCRNTKNCVNSQQRENGPKYICEIRSRAQYRT